MSRVHQALALDDVPLSLSLLGCLFLAADSIQPSTQSYPDTGRTGGEGRDQDRLFLLVTDFIR